MNLRTLMNSFDLLICGVISLRCNGNTINLIQQFITFLFIWCPANIDLSK